MPSPTLLNIAPSSFYRLGICLAVSLTISCQSNDSVRQDERPSSPPPPVDSAPDIREDAGAPDETDSSKPDEPFMLPSGNYWVRRPSRFGLTTGSAQSGPPPKSQTRGSTACHRLSWSAHNARLSLSDRRWKLDFRAIQADGHLMLHGPHLEREYVQLSGHCSQELIVEKMKGVKGVLRSNAGPIFTDQKNCHEAPSSFVHRCVGDDCSYDEPTSQPFALSDCETAMAGLKGQAHVVLGTEHSEAMQTLVELEERSRKGGKLWQRLSGEQACGQVSVFPLENGRVRMESHSPSSDGGYVEKYATYKLAPLFHHARRYSYGSTSYDSDGKTVGMGAAGSGHGQVGLYMTADAVLLGERLLYLDRSVCEAQ